MKLSLFALLAASAFAQKAPLTAKQQAAIKKNAIKQAEIAKNKAISKAQQQADAAGIDINVQELLNTVRANNEAKAQQLVNTYTAKAQNKQNELANQYAQQLKDLDTYTAKAQNKQNELANQ